MKNILQPLIVVILVVAAAYGIPYVWPLTGMNPDPNHAHADFAVWMPTSGNPDETQNIEKLDFSADKYMSGSSTDPGSHPTEGLRKYLHLHDGNGHVMHRHKPGLTIGDFFRSIGGDMTTTTVDAGRTIPAKCFLWEDVSGKSMGACGGEWGQVMHMFVNGKETDFDPDYVFTDEDQILIISAGTDSEVQTALSQMTDDACLYSKTCPWRGTPPTEGCIADPEVPCRE